MNFIKLFLKNIAILVIVLFVISCIGFLFYSGHTGIGIIVFLIICAGIKAYIDLQGGS